MNQKITIVKWGKEYLSRYEVKPKFTVATKYGVCIPKTVRAVNDSEILEYHHIKEGLQLINSEITARNDK